METSLSAGTVYKEFITVFLSSERISQRAEHRLDDREVVRWLYLMRFCPCLVSIEKEPVLRSASEIEHLDAYTAAFQDTVRIDLPHLLPPMKKGIAFQV